MSDLIPENRRQRKCFDALNPGDLFTLAWPWPDPDSEREEVSVWKLRNGASVSSEDFLAIRRKYVPEILDIAYRDKVFVLLDKSIRSTDLDLRIKALDSEHGVIFVGLGDFIAEKVSP